MSFSDRPGVFEEPGAVAPLWHSLEEISRANQEAEISHAPIAQSKHEYPVLVRFRLPDRTRITG